VVLISENTCVLNVRNHSIPIPTYLHCSLFYCKLCGSKLTIVIFDLTGIELGLQLLPVYETYYPETAHKLISVNSKNADVLGVCQIQFQQLFQRLGTLLSILISFIAPRLAVSIYNTFKHVVSEYSLNTISIYG